MPTDVIKEAIEALEPQSHAFEADYAVQLSKAISLKRIADALDKLNEHSSSIMQDVNYLANKVHT